MFKDLKIKTAAFICQAFICSLLFLNISAFAAVSSQSLLINKSTVGISKLTFGDDNHAIVYSAATDNALQVTDQEFLEDEDDSFDSKVTFLLFSPCFLNGGAFNQASSQSHFTAFKNGLESKKYLSLSVLRI